MNNIVTDNRFEIIKKAEKILFEVTNIQDCPEEVEQLSSILFRLWQCNLLKTDNTEVIEHIDEDTRVYQCGDCLCSVDITDNYCRVCGAYLNWVERKE